ncbi:MAG: hypothetical protein ACRDGI_04730 [Candidatus Limnocylindrales bacterium]
MNPRPAVFVLALLVVSACSPVAIVSTQPSASPTLVASPSAASQASPIPPSAAPSDVGLRLPNPGGTCAASQFHLGQATLTGEPSTWGGAHVGIDQPLRNDGPKCVLALPRVIGLAAAQGPFVSASIGNLGVEVYANGVGRTVYPTSFTIPAGGSVRILFNAFWQVETLSGSPAPPDCSSPLSGINRAEFPFASGAVDIDWITPLDEVCAPAQFTMTVESS